MGNVSSSTDKESEILNKSVVSRKQLKSLFRREVKTQFPNIELINISEFLFGEVTGLDNVVSFTDFLAKLDLKDQLNTEQRKMMYYFLRKLANWPCVSDEVNSDIGSTGDGVFTLFEILVIVHIIYKDGILRLGLDEDYLIKLYFILFCDESNPPEIGTAFNDDGNGGNQDAKIDLITSNGKIKWDLLPIVQSYDKLESYGVDRLKLHTILEVLLPLSVHNLNSKSFALNYKLPINSIINTLSLSSSETLITFDTFLLNYKNFTPRLLTTLKKMLHPLLFERLHDRSKPTKENLEINYKILNLPLLAQLTTMLDIGELNLEINSKPLYRGSKEGYSINSIQSHTINYNATSLLLISGKTVDSTGKFLNQFFAKFPKFHPVVNSEMEIKEKSKFQVAVLLTTPWRITNTKNFGAKDFKIIQLSPFQVIFDSSRSIKSEYAYFSNNGSGLGFGSKPPKKSKDIKDHSMKFENTGGVSLTVDNSLEIGNFRIEDMSAQSSVYSTSQVSENIFNDIWFKINEIEIYGLGNLESLEDQRKAMEWEEREAERRRGLGAKDYLESKALLELAGIIGGAQSGGSV